MKTKILLNIFEKYDTQIEPVTLIVAARSAPFQSRLLMSGAIYLVTVASAHLVWLIGWFWPLIYLKKLIGFQNFQIQNVFQAILETLIFGPTPKFGFTNSDQNLQCSNQNVFQQIPSNSRPAS